MKINESLTSSHGKKTVVWNIIELDRYTAYLPCSLHMRRRKQKSSCNITNIPRRLNNNGIFAVVFARVLVRTAYNICVFLLLFVSASSMKFRGKLYPEPYYSILVHTTHDDVDEGSFVHSTHYNRIASHTRTNTNNT